MSERKIDEVTGVETTGRIDEPSRSRGIAAPTNPKTPTVLFVIGDA